MGEAGRLEGRDGAYGTAVAGLRGGPRTMLAAAFVTAGRAHGPGEEASSVWGARAPVAATGGKDGHVYLWNAREARAVKAVRPPEARAGWA